MARLLPEEVRSATEVVNAARRITGLNARQASTAELRAKLHSVDEGHRKALLQLVLRALPQDALLWHEDARVVASKLAVALLPDSITGIERCLRNRRAIAAEMQFSLLCFLSDAQPLRSSALSRRLLGLVGELLLDTRRDIAHAAWMAGDLLGDHWDLREGLRVLRKVALHGRYVVGRQAAIHGLFHLGERAPAAYRLQVARVLRRVARSDRNTAVRHSAARALEGRTA